MACRTCRQSLSRVRNPDGTIWWGHPGMSTHKVEPVWTAPEDTVFVCDFCLAPNPRWSFPLLEHATTTLFSPDIMANVTAVDVDAWWGACDTCADLIRNRCIGKLRDRALAAAVRSLGKPPSAWEKESLFLQLAAFWAAVPGPPIEAEV